MQRRESGEKQNIFYMHMYNPYGLIGVMNCNALHKSYFCFIGMLRMLQEKGTSNNIRYCIMDYELGDIFSVAFLI